MTTVRGTIIVECDLEQLKKLVQKIRKSGIKLKDWNYTNVVRW